jgi:PAS domain S-box-containing protein
VERERERDQGDLLEALARTREDEGMLLKAYERTPVPLVLWVPDRAQRVRGIDPNRAMCDLLGYTSAELVALGPADITHPDDLEVGCPDVERLLAGEIESCSYEKRLVRADGRVIWAQLTLSTASYRDGRPEYGICQIEDITDRREAHDSLRASEQRLRTLMDTAHEGIWILDADDRTTFANGRLAEMLGYEPAELSGRPVYDFLAEQGRSVMRARMAARRRGLSDSQELRFIRRDGREQWVILSGSPLTDEAGEYAGTLEMVADITERKLREEALRASEERYRNIVETTSEGVWMIDADHRTTYVNARMAQMLGYSVEEMLGRPVADFTPADQHLDTMQRDEEREVCYLRRDGSQMWGLLSGSPLADGKGGYGGALAMITDITERKRAECELARMAAIVESSPDAMLSIDVTGTITVWNAAAEQLWGYTRDEAIGQSAWMLVPPDKVEERRRLKPGLMAGGTHHAFRTTTRRKDGAIVEIEPSVSAIEDASGKVTGVLAVVRVAG